MPPIHFNNKGQATVEAALLTPILVFLISGVFVAGMYINAKLITAAAAREGARSFALTGECSSLIASVKKTMDALDTDPQGDRIKISVGPQPLPKIGQDLIVQVAYKWPTLYPFFQKYYEQVSGQSFDLGQTSGQATVRMEVDSDQNQACGA